MNKYEFLIYDVWGNSKDGYEVNDVQHADAEPVVITEQTSDRDIVKAAKAAGILKRNIRHSSIRIDGELGGSLYLTYIPDEYPLCELRKMED